MSCWLGGVRETNKHDRLLISLGFPPVIEGKSLLLMMPYTSDPGGSRLDPSWKPPPWGLAFLIPEGTIQAAGEEKEPVSYLAVTPMRHNNNDRHDKMSLKVTRSFLSIQGLQTTSFLLRILKNLNNSPTDRQAFIQPAAGYAVTCCDSQQISVFRSLGNTSQG